MIDFQKCLVQLTDKGWFHQKNAFSQDFVKDIKQAIIERNLVKAGIGQSKVVHSDIRNDSIFWIEPEDPSSAIQKYLHFLKKLQVNLNQSLFLGIQNFEVHLAQYQKGGFYKPHYDNFQGKNNRVVTIITYLNENWNQEDGGLLRLHHQGEIVDIQPEAGSLAMFISEDILHEVSESYKTRQSITGWFLRQN